MRPQVKWCIKRTTVLPLFLYSLLLGTFAKLRKATVIRRFVVPLRLSVTLSASNSLAPTEQIFMKFDI